MESTGFLDYDAVFLHSAQFSLNVDVGNGSVINIHGDVKNLKG